MYSMGLNMMSGLNITQQRAQDNSDAGIDLESEVRCCAGVTLIEVNPPPNPQLFRQIHRKVQPGSSAYGVYKEAKRLCKETYLARGYVYDMAVVEEIDKNSILLFETDAVGSVISTLRICLDGDFTLPITQYVPSTYMALTKTGMSLAEPGRFVVNGESKIYRRFVSAAYEIGVSCGVSAHLMQVRSDHVDFYRRYCGAQVIPFTRSPDGCTNMIWRLKKTPKIFFRVFGQHSQGLQNILASGESDE